jgi:hypothetical protein
MLSDAIKNKTGIINTFEDNLMIHSIQHLKKIMHKYSFCRKMPFDSLFTPLNLTVNKQQGGNQEKIIGAAIFIDFTE